MLKPCPILRQKDGIPIFHTYDHSGHDSGVGGISTGAFHRPFLGGVGHGLTAAATETGVPIPVRQMHSRKDSVEDFPGKAGCTPQRPHIHKLASFRDGVFLPEQEETVIVHRKQVSKRTILRQVLHPKKFLILPGLHQQSAAIKKQDKVLPLRHGQRVILVI